MTVTVPFPGELIRPWYPAGITGHIFADCEELLFWEPEPREGSGWLDPRQPDTRRPVCEDCLLRHDPTIHAAVFPADDYTNEDDE